MVTTVLHVKMINVEPAWRCPVNLFDPVTGCAWRHFQVPQEAQPSRRASPWHPDSLARFECGAFSIVQNGVVPQIFAGWKPSDRAAS